MAFCVDCTHLRFGRNWGKFRSVDKSFYSWEIQERKKNTLENAPIESQSKQYRYDRREQMKEMKFDSIIVRVKKFIYFTIFESYQIE